jgi:hypothetical protein
MKKIFLGVLLAASVCLAISAQPAQHYRHEKTGIEFDAPDGWHYVQTVTLLDGGDQAQWSVPSLDVTVYAYLSDGRQDRASIDDRLNSAVERKIAQRRSAQYRNYDIPRDTVHRTTINGHPALVATARFDTGPQLTVPILEHVAWIMSPTAGVFLFAPAPAAKSEALRPQFERFLASVRLP